MKFKILVVGSFRSTEFGVVGGIARSCEELMTSEFTERFEVVTVDSTQRTNPPPNVAFRGIKSVIRFFQLILGLLKHRPDGVLLFFSSGLSFYEKILMGWVAKFLKARVFLFPRAGALFESSARSKFISTVHRFLFRCGDVFLAQGPKWRRYALDVCAFQEKDVYIVPNWTAAKRFFLVGTEKISKHKPKNKPTLLFVGWLEIEKGVRELLQACKMLEKSSLNFTCLLAGDGAQKQWAQKFVNQHGLEGKVKLKGWVKGDDLVELYRAADIFVLPSWEEGMSNSLIEGMSSGLCPVVTNVGIIPDFLCDREHGRLVPPRSVEALYEALSTLIKKPDLRAKYAQAAYHLSKQFDKDCVISELSDIVGSRLSN